jgi:hypothetical protein
VKLHQQDHNDLKVQLEHLEQQGQDDLQVLLEQQVQLDQQVRLIKIVEMDKFCNDLMLLETKYVKNLPLLHHHLEQ